MVKKRIYEVARDYKISSNALLKILRDLKHTPKSHMSVATDDMLRAIRIKFAAEKAALKKDIQQKKKRSRPRPPQKHISKETQKQYQAKLPKTKVATGENMIKTESIDSKVQQPAVVQPDRFPKKKKRRDKRKRRDARKVDQKAVVKSYKATMASMGTAKKIKKYKRALKSEMDGDTTAGNTIDVNEFMTIAELAGKLELKPAELIAKCFEMGMMATINQRLDLDTIEMLALEYGYNISEKEEVGEEARDSEDEKNLCKRAPVVTVMGHVDHGKTSLLDFIRKTNVVGDEAGAITQHIGAYVVNTDGGDITFIDTPGHEAFTAMRARGAQITDMVVLVVAADDGVKPQTIEAIDHARSANVPIIVAINKIDKPAANPESVKQQLANYNLSPEEWGGKTIMAEISAKTGQGIDSLLEMILLQAEILDLEADPTIRGQGIVIEAKLEKGRGPSCTVIVQKGNIKIGDPVCAGTFYGRVRVMYSDREKKLDMVGPSEPVRFTGLNGVPQAGDSFMVVKDDQDARQISVKRTQIKREYEIRRGFGRATLENIYAQIRDGQIKELRLIIKADVDGSAEVLAETLGKIGTDEVRTTILHKGVGAVTETDVLLAATSGAIIIGFNVTPDARAREMAAKEKVDIRKYDVIYEVEKDVRNALEGMLTPDKKETFCGLAEVRQIFKVPKIGTVAGCFVREGTIRRVHTVHITRDGIIIHTGELSSLKRFKDDVREVTNGYECGIGIENFNDIKVGDLIEAFEIEEIARKLEQ